MFKQVRPKCNSKLKASMQVSKSILNVTLNKFDNLNVGVKHFVSLTMKKNEGHLKNEKVNKQVK